MKWRSSFRPRFGTRLWSAILRIGSGGNPAARSLAMLVALAASASLPAFSAHAAAAQQAGRPAMHGMTVADVLQLQGVDAAAVDPHSALVALVVQRPREAGEALLTEGYYRGNVRGDLVVLSATTGQVVMRTRGRAGHKGYWNPVWSGSGRQLAMLTFRADTLSVCVWNRDFGTMSCLPGARSLDYMTQLSAGITPRGSSSLGRPFLWLSDSVLAVAVLPSGDLDRLALAQHSIADSLPATWMKSARGEEASVGVRDTPRPKAAGTTFAEIRLWNVERGSTRLAFTVPYFGQGFRDVVFSPGHERAAVLADYYRDISDPRLPFGFQNRRRKELGVVDLAHGTAVRWLPRHPYTRFVRWAQGGRRFGIIAKQSDDEDEAGGSALFVVDPGDMTLDSTADPRTDSALRWESQMAPVIELPGRSRLVSRPEVANGTRVELEPGDEVLSVAPDGTFAIIRRLTAEGTIVYQRFAGGKRPRMLLTLNAHLKRVARSSRRLITYRARDGSEQRAVVLLPPGFEPGVRYPLITWVYPGDIYRDTSSSSFLRPIDDPLTPFLSPAILAGHGYAVLFPSMPLVPYGTAGEPFYHMLDGVDAAIDTLIVRGMVDSSRLGIIGHSYGGYAVNCIVSQSRRFRAAVSSAGLVDLTSASLQFYPQTQFAEWPAVELPLMETGQGRMGTPPWRDPERYVRNSPLYHVDSVHAPILISVGDNDFAGQAEEWFTALDRAGKRARLLIFRGEGHVLLSPANISRFWEEALRWFDEHLRPPPGTMDTRPAASCASCERP